MNSNDDDERPQIRSALLLSTAGLTLAFAAVIGFVGGYYLDRWLGTSPWFVLVFGALGVIAGFRELIRTLNKVNQEEDRRARRAREPRKGAQTDRDAANPRE